MVRTSGFHPDNGGSTPPGDGIKKEPHEGFFFYDVFSPLAKIQCYYALRESKYAPKKHARRRACLAENVAWHGPQKILPSDRNLSGPRF